MDTHPLHGLTIIPTPWAPAPELKQYPKKGPYWQRRLNKLKRDPKNWTEPVFYLVSDRLMIAHPSVIPLIKEAIEFHGNPPL